MYYLYTYSTLNNISLVEIVASVRIRYICPAERNSVQGIQHGPGVNIKHNNIDIKLIV